MVVGHSGHEKPEDWPTIGSGIGRVFRRSWRLVIYFGMLVYIEVIFTNEKR